MTILQQVPGISQVRMYDKRDDMPTLRHYRKFPHVETILSVRCKYATLHSQLLCRFAYRCSVPSYFARAAANLIRYMHSHGYDKPFLRRKVYNFSKTFWRVTRIRTHRRRDRIWYGINAEIFGRVGSGHV